MTPSLLIRLLWFLFLAYWVLMAAGAKKSAGGRSWKAGSAARAGIVLLILVMLNGTVFRRALMSMQANPGVVGLPLGIAGIAVCLLGMGFAVWARLHLGRNWGMPMSRKEQPELVTSGPYAYVRHPIYTGFFTAMLGSALAAGPSWAVMALACGAFFVYSARREEQLMLEQFPEQYPAYMRRTKMLVPFLF
jgi:protein-S-isoprenylcysteine O-methyltransferase Ste14